MKGSECADIMIFKGSPRVLVVNYRNQIFIANLGKTREGTYIEELAAIDTRVYPPFLGRYMLLSLW